MSFAEPPLQIYFPRLDGTIDSSVPAVSSPKLFVTFSR